MGEEWINLDELIAVAGWSLRTIQTKARAGELIWRASRQRGRNGRPLREYSVRSLSPSIQMELHRRRSTRGASSRARDAKSDQQITLFGDNSVGAPTTHRMPVTDAQKEQGEGRISTLAPLIEYLRLGTREEKRAWCAQRGLLLRNADSLAKCIAKEKGVGKSTVWRWYAAWQKRGPEALFDGDRKDKGHSRWFAAHPEAKFVAASAWLRAAQSRRAVWDAVARWCHERGIDPPSYDTVRVWLDSGEVPRPLSVWARDGDRALNARMLPYITRDYSSVKVNQIWISDHMIHDSIVANDCFAGDRQHAPVRLRLTCVIDFRSRRVVGYSWTLDGSSRSIASALRMAIGRFGAPQTFYVDNGEDYKRVARGADRVWKRESNPEFARDIEWLEGLGVLQRLGIGVQHCLKYHPQSKHIERFFRTLHQRLDASSIHYTGADPSLRPDNTERATARHQRLVRNGRPEASPLMPASHFIRAAIEWIENDYNLQHAHRGSGMNGRTPAEVFDTGLPPENRRIPDLSAMDYFFWESARRKVLRGKITAGGTDWTAADEQSNHALYFAGESEVLIHFDPHWRDRALVTDANGRAIARVRPEIPVPQSPAARPAVAQSMSLRRRLRNATADTVREIRRRAAASGHVDGFEDLRRRALRSSAVDAVLTQPSVKPTSTTAPCAPMTAEEIAADFWDSEQLQSEDIGERLVERIRSARA